MKESSRSSQISMHSLLSGDWEGRGSWSEHAGGEGNGESGGGGRAGEEGGRESLSLPSPQLGSMDCLSYNLQIHMLAVIDPH